MKHPFRNSPRRMPVVFLAACMQASTPVVASVVSFESGELDARFVSDKLSPYQPNPYDQPVDGADNLAQMTASEWVAINPAGMAVVDLYWDGGLSGGSNSPLNLLLADTFDLVQFHVAGIYGSQTLTVRGYNNTGLLYEDSLFIDLTPRLFTAGWTGIDQLQFIVGDDYGVAPGHAGAGDTGYWAIDNLVFDESMPEVPLPAALWLFLSGLLLLFGTGALRRR